MLPDGFGPFISHSDPMADCRGSVLKVHTPVYCCMIDTSALVVWRADSGPLGFPGAELESQGSPAEVL